MIDKSSPPPAADVAPWRRTENGGRMALVLLLLCGVLCPPLAAEDAAATVSGRVVGGEHPISLAQVYAYEVATYALEKVTTDPEGHFLFKSLPAGLYKIIAHKEGFLPTVELLLRRSADARQFVTLRLAEDETGDVRAAESYWDARARIPADVLRQIRQPGLRKASLEAGLEVENAALVETQMAAHGGVAHLGEASGDARLTDAAIGVRGALGQMRVGFDGRFAELTPSGETVGIPGSEVLSMALSLENAHQSRLSLATAASDLAERRGGEIVPVDLRNYRLHWSGPAGGGSSDISAQIVDESNYYNSGFSSDLPEASRTLKVQGSYRRDVTRNTSLTTGLNYRQRESARLLHPDGTLNDEVVGVYGMAGSQIQPRILVEYGLYSSMREGALSLMPHGGMVVKLGSSWQARTSFAQRVEREKDDLLYDRFNAAFYGDRNTCRQTGEACYEVTFTRGSEEEESLSVGAIHREFAETLRLYFSDDFFHRLESLLVVPGDEIPELKFRMVRRMSPKVLAKLESNIASGGGGIFYATDETAYENQVRYLVTSLDTRFQSTATGVFLAFHHLEQALNPLSETTEASGTDVEIQRLQVMLTQDLSALANIAPSLAVRLNMELSRGATPYTLTDGDDLHKKLTGGITVSF